ncbi:50S ribosomal protein L24 [Thermovirga sp.]|jgi:large subunit ribosomal protein L24|uniref:Large ribosomal subunit protein uL24 n=1 Tax=Thermovirga lienii (strain ATCC BAA-1197 / DSM 17291 / Cas60314) TaxID=580340 RepID=G7V8V1_THELD|nr:MULTISPECIES: 50S ribosomal protein L24 [Thermovirga]AER66392.1 ribosomal protein L24 [Thermovirga lienii DSM 17291]
MSKMRIKKGDRVRVISGKDKGKEGKVLRRDPKRDMVVVEGVNMVTKHVRPSAKNPSGGIIKQEAPIYACKVMLVCPACGNPTRVSRAYLEDGSKVRICKKCNEIIDKV